MSTQKSQNASSCRDSVPSGLPYEGRRRAERPWLAALAVGLLLAVGCAEQPESPILGPIEGQAAEQTGPLTLTPIRFATTDFFLRPKVIEAEEGRLTVPERHAEPGGRQITIRFVRFRSTAKDPGPPIVYLAGGPGGSGVWSSSGDRFPLFQRLREVADVIALDQRGTWGTEPYMVCPGSWDYPLDQPASFATLETVLRPYLRECATHWQERADVGAYNTRESAGDLEALRIALGASKLSLWGISYGTHLGLAYMKLYPEGTHRAILAGIEGPDHTYKLPSRVDLVARRIFEEIAQDERAREIIPDFEAKLRATIQRLERAAEAVELEHPETGERVKVVVGAEDLRNALYSAMGEREDIEEILQRVAPILRGDFQPLARYAMRSRLENRELVMALSMDCASGASEQRKARIQEELESSLLGDRSGYLRAACPHWPAEDLGQDFRTDPVSSVPTLILSGTFDVKTPPENAEDVLPGLENARHLVIEGGSHDDDLFLSSPMIAESMIRFLRGGEPDERVDLGPIRFERP